MGKLDGRRILVTGASSGIGAATAIALSDAGARVALLARSPSALNELAERTGGVAVPADVTDLEQVSDAVAAAVDALGGLDGVVNNAGLTRPGSIVDGDPADWRLMFDVNVLGLLAVTSMVTPHLRASGGGDIVNVSSMSGRRLASISSTVYSATKFAVHTISEGLREELAGDGIRVTVISPGFVDTEIFDDLEGDEAARLRERKSEVGLAADAVAGQIVHAVATPPGMTLVEIAMVSTGQ